MNFQSSQIKVLISFDLSENYVENLRKDFPNVEFLVTDDKEKIIKVIQDVDAVFAFKNFNSEMFRLAKRLKWIHSRIVGVDWLLAIQELAESDVIITCSRGIHPIQASDHAFALILALSRKLHIFMRFQREKKWDRTPAVDELAGKTIGIIGLGAIGTEIARKAKCFGMKVMATKRKPVSPPAFVDELLPTKDLHKLLTKSDFVVLAVPLTPETAEMIGERELRFMKKEAYMINIARGEVVQEEKLIKALKEGWIAGAGLDAFVHEFPLPPESELWDLKNVLITPHIAGETRKYLDKAIPLFRENLKRFLNKQPMINVVDKKVGY